LDRSESGQRVAYGMWQENSVLRWEYDGPAERIFAIVNRARRAMKKVGIFLGVCAALGLLSNLTHHLEKPATPTHGVAATTTTEAPPTTVGKPAIKPVPTSPTTQVAKFKPSNTDKAFLVVLRDNSPYFTLFSDRVLVTNAHLLCSDLDAGLPIDVEVAGMVKSGMPSDSAIHMLILSEDAYCPQHTS